MTGDPFKYSQGYSWSHGTPGASRRSHLDAGVEKEVDTFVEGAEFIVALSGDAHRAYMALHRCMMVGFDCSSARKSLDLSGSLLASGSRDAPVHLDSTMATVPGCAGTVVFEAITTAVVGPTRWQIP